VKETHEYEKARGLLLKPGAVAARAKR
jgi:hypothetical protein